MSNNISRLRGRMDLASLPGMLVADARNVQWLTGFTGSFGRVMLTLDEGIFITDSRYGLQAQDQVKGLKIEVFSTPTTDDQAIAKASRMLGVQKLGFERSITFDQWEKWTTAMEQVQLIPAPDIITQLRLVKTSEEIEKIRAACKLADACVEHAARMIQPGVSEFDIGLDIEFFFRRQGAGIAFPPIVASGPNSAKPHGRASERKIEKGDFVTLDLGCTLDGYNSDITRTFVVGEASERQKLIYNQVLKAQVAAIDAIKPGANGKDVDALSRQVLDEQQFAQYFGHGLGHGLGIDVHDGGRLSSGADQPIASGQVWTVEPGVYIDGYGGVRIEDDVVVTETGNEVLTHFPKTLTVL